MKARIIGVKQLHRELRDITREALNGKSFLVVKNSRPVFRILPLRREKKTNFDLEDFQEIAFRGGKNLSRRMDRLIYGHDHS